MPNREKSLYPEGMSVQSLSLIEIVHASVLFSWFLLFNLEVGLKVGM